jgi:magnesium-transporting ATPase (P-type)
MSVVVAGEGVRLLLCKGAPESILKRCSSALVNTPGTSAQTAPLQQGTRDAVLDRMAQYGGEGLLCVDLCRHPTCL